ncbi:MAG TPA: hypothetical protein VGH33_01540 [Isosphaeraceae bacterium]|jgi:hypothetical protein
MTTIALQAKIHAKPFKPFRIKMADGSTHDVRHPDFIAYGDATHTCVVFGEGERLSILDLLLMTELQDLVQPADAGSAR